MTKSETGRMVAYGVAGWFVAAMIIRGLGPHMFNQALLHLAMLVIAAVIAWPTVRIAEMMLDDQQSAGMLAPIAVFTATATVIDGIALSFAPWIYGDIGLHTGFAGGTILFGVGALLIVGMIADSRRA
ncbi:hypothetical protein [Yoonia sp. 208BN28-4]|uniref:hypothetical protein n=1 Tax=Yoonia sp. 208BN28-4 TaxID=3126505 RepID=UPI003099D5F0